MRSATLYAYCLPMDAGMVLRHRRLTSRDGLVAVLEQDGRVGMGEIAPLPGFSLETLAEASAAAQAMLQRWAAGDSDGQVSPENPLEGLPNGQLAPPSVAFGISCALAELAGRLPDARGWQTVPLVTGDLAMLLPALAAMPGIKKAKVKVGMHEAIRDSQRVNQLLAALPDWRLRLDANRSWTPAQAAAFVRGLDPAAIGRIDFIEEPCATPAESLAFAQDSGIAIAWDESAREPGFLLAARPGVAAVIVKPSLTGSLDVCRSLIRRAD